MNITPRIEFTEFQTELIQVLFSEQDRTIESMMRQGDVMVKLVETDPDIIDKLCQKYPDRLSEFFLKQMLRVGRKETHPAVLLSDNPNIRQLAHKPYDVQVKLLTEQVEVVHLVPSQDGRPPEITTVKKDYAALSVPERRRAVGRFGVRPKEEQITLLREEATVKASPALAKIQEYEINKRDRTLIVNTPMSFNVDLLLRILRDYIGLKKREIKFLGDGK